MRLALFTSGFLPGIDGVTISVWRRVERLSRWGHRVLVLAPDYRPAARHYPEWRRYVGEVLPGVTVVPLPSRASVGGELERGLTPWGYAVALRELGRFRPEAIHVDEPERCAFGFLVRPGIGYARRRGLPCLCTFHTNFLEYGEDYLPLLLLRLVERPFRDAYLPWVYNAYDATLVGSTVTHRKLRGFGIRNTVRLDLSGVELSRFDGPRAPSPDGRVRAVVLGRLTADKGWAFLLRAFEAAPPELRDRLELLIVGDGDLRTEIGRRVPWARVLGRVPNDAVPGLLLGADLYLTASEKENRSVAKLEAMAAGLPVVAPRVPWTTGEDLVDGGNALLFAPGDVGDFLGLLRRLVADDALRERLGTAARASVAHLDWDRTVGSWLAAVEERLPGSRGGAAGW